MPTGSDPQQARRALLVASENYADPGLKKLRAPSGDVRALANVLSDPSVGGFEVRPLIDQPTEEVKHEIEGFFDEARLHDLLLLYFSGHGLISQTRRFYFATPTTQLRRLRTTAIDETFINEGMQHSRARSIVLIIDCCHSGAFTRGLIPKGHLTVDVPQRFEGRGRITLTASTELEYAFEGIEAEAEAPVSSLAAHTPGSVFTRHVVEGLRTGKADLDRNGVITIDELYDYVYAKVREASRAQTPGRSGTAHGDILIAKSTAPDVGPDASTPEARRTPTRPLAHVAQASPVMPHEVLRMAHEGKVRSLALTPDGERLVSGSWDATARIWDLHDGRELFCLRHDGWVNSVDINPLASTALTGSADKTVRCWSLDDGRELFRLPHRADVRAVAVSPDGNKVATGGVDKTARLRGYADRQQILLMKHRRWENWVHSLAFSPDGTLLATGSGRGLQIWSLADGSECASGPWTDIVPAVEFSPDGTFLAAGHRGSMKSATVSSITRDGQWNYEHRSGSYEFGLLQLEHQDRVVTVAFAPDGSRLATGSEDRTARLWSLDGREIHRISHDAEVTAVTFTPDGDRLITADADGAVRVWVLP